jgi:hypothetical protein
MTSTTKELLCIGVLCVALYFTAWPIVEFLK